MPHGQERLNSVAVLRTMDKETKCPMGYRQAYSTGGITHI